MKPDMVLLWEIGNCRTRLLCPICVNINWCLREQVALVASLHSSWRHTSAISHFTLSWRTSISENQFCKANRQKGRTHSDRASFSLVRPKLKASPSALHRTTSLPSWTADSDRAFPDTKHCMGFPSTSSRRCSVLTISSWEIQAPPPTVESRIAKTHIQKYEIRKYVVYCSEGPEYQENTREIFHGVFKVPVFSKAGKGRQV